MYTPMVAEVGVFKIAEVPTNWYEYSIPENWFYKRAKQFSIMLTIIYLTAVC